MFTQDEYTGQTFKAETYTQEELIGTNFEDCTFVECNFTESVFKNCRFQQCKFENCDLSMAKVKGSIFRGVEFVKCRLLGINWTDASWGRKDTFQLIRSVDFDECILNFGSFFGLTLKNLRIIKCTAREVDFSEANFSKADFSGTDLQGSIFRNTTLEEANLVSAKNYSLSPTHNKITKARFSLPEAMALLYNLDIVLADDEGLN